MPHAATGRENSVAVVRTLVLLAALRNSGNRKPDRREDRGALLPAARPDFQTLTTTTSRAPLPLFLSVPLQNVSSSLC